jgi:hypothetical protein
VGEAAGVGRERPDEGGRVPAHREAVDARQREGAEAQDEELEVPVGLSPDGPPRTSKLNASEPRQSARTSDRPAGADGPAGSGRAPQDDRPAGADGPAGSRAGAAGRPARGGQTGRPACVAADHPDPPACVGRPAPAWDVTRPERWPGRELAPTPVERPSTRRTATTRPLCGRVRAAHSAGYASFVRAPLAWPPGRLRALVRAPEPAARPATRAASAPLTRPLRALVRAPPPAARPAMRPASALYADRPAGRAGRVLLGGGALREVRSQDPVSRCTSTFPKGSLGTS